jgi:hypothetical protein
VKENRKIKHTAFNVAAQWTRKKEEVGVAETEIRKIEEAAIGRTGEDDSQRRDATGRRRGCLRVTII